jgi:cell fate regulator YaaT (PSP1 superfamily)
MTTKVTVIDCRYSLSLVEIPYSEKADVSVGDNIIFKDEEGKEEYGIIKHVCQDSSDEETILFTSKILRIATANDLQKVSSYERQADRALPACKTLIASLGLEMFVFRAAYSFDGSKVHFMFTADERIDFRDLVRDLAKKLKKQIHLRQIGPRDKAKLLGGYGRCGRSLCCNTFLGKLESINMDMVRDQGLEGKGSSKLSGACGKLLCCLKYELAAYRELRKILPPPGSFVRLKKTAPVSSKDGMVVAIDVLNQKVKVRLDKEESLTVDFDMIEKVLKLAPESTRDYPLK